VVFTVPVCLRRFFLGKHRRHALDALFAAVSESILETAARRGLLPGILAVLPTWNHQLGDVGGDRETRESDQVDSCLLGSARGHLTC
jgi:hypothetical protein